MAQHSFVTHPIALRRLEVVRTEDLNPRMRRVTLSGAQFRAFERDGFALPAFLSTGFDDHVKLLFAAEGPVEDVLPIQRAASIDWTEAEHRRMRDYTPSRVDMQRGEVDLDFVVHGDGPAATWAMGAQPGDGLYVLGPKSSIVLPDDVSSLVLAGDETALPAIGRYLRERADERPVHVVVEVADPVARQDLPVRAQDSLRWVVTPHGSPSQLAQAVQDLPLPEEGLYVWAAAESRSLLPLRRWASRERALPKSHINITGYWHDVPPDSDAETTSPAEPTALSPLPWFAARAALRLGVLDAVADRPVSVDELALVTGVPARRLGVLLRTLEPVGVVSVADDTVSIGVHGARILDDEHVREGIDDTLEVQMLLAMTDLATTLRSGDESGYRRTHGASLREQVDADAERFTELVEQSLGLAFVGVGVPTALGDPASAVLTGPGSATMARILGGDTTIVEAGAGLAVLAKDAPGAATASSFEGLSADVAISCHAIAYRTDAEATALLTALVDAGRAAYLLEDVGAGGASAHDTEHDLLSIAAVGTPRRTLADLAALVTTAGLQIARSTSIGWNHELILITR